MGMREEFEAAMSKPRDVYWHESEKRYMTSWAHLDCIAYQGKWMGWQASRAALVLDFKLCNVQHASYNNVDCYSINDVKVIAQGHGVGVRTK